MHPITINIFKNSLFIAELRRKRIGFKIYIPNIVNQFVKITVNRAEGVYVARIVLSIFPQIVQYHIYVL